MTKKLTSSGGRKSSGPQWRTSTLGVARGPYGVPKNSAFLQKQKDVIKAMADAAVKRQQKASRKYKYMSRREFLEYIECCDVDGHAKKLHNVNFYLNGMGRLIDLVIHLSKELAERDKRLERYEEAEGGPEDRVREGKGNVGVSERKDHGRELRDGKKGRRKKVSRDTEKTPAGPSRPRYEVFDGKTRSDLSGRGGFSLTDNRRRIVEGDELEGYSDFDLRPSVTGQIEIDRRQRDKGNG